MVLIGNGMGSSEIWDKYHSCCIGNDKFPIQHSWYLFQISLLPMLLLVRITFIIILEGDTTDCLHTSHYSVEPVSLHSLQ